MRRESQMFQKSSNYRTFESDENIFIFAYIYRKHLAKSYMKSAIVAL